MSSFRKPILVLMGLALLVSAAPVFGQGSALYSNNATQLQTRNIPAGTVVDPGSQLLYIMDTGVNLRAAVGADVSLYTSPLSVVNQGPRDSAGNFIAPNPFGVGGSQSIYNADGTLNPDLINRNFITITNTHPTQAVTVHFRYFNDECVDVLDFLVLLTCNDTLIFDPFDFNIPGTSFNTRNRIFGPAVGLFRPIRAADFASGRFLIFATAAGTSYEPENAGIHDDNAELRFPFEFRGFVSADNHCDNLVGTGANGDQNDFFGRASGLRPNNLHVFNSSAVAFNYLIGSWTTAVPFSGVFQAYGINAWTRPAVDLTNEFGNMAEADSNRDEPDGDGPPLLGDPIAGGNDFRILTGTEPVRAANGSSLVQDNFLYLRNDVHGGDTARINDIDVDGVDDLDSWYGALGITSLFGANPSLQTFNFLSVIDDYNGTRHANDTPVGGFIDRSYNLNGARTVYVLQIYDNDENLFDVEEDTPINISPPPFEAPTAILKITVDCLRVWITDVVSNSTSVDDLSIADLGGIADGLVDHLTQTVNPQVDASQGWIRFVRDNSGPGAASDGGPLFGTWEISELDARLLGGIDDQEYGSFVTIAHQIVRFSGFGASWWLSSAASDPLVSETGDPQCDGLCPNGAGRRP